MRPERPIVSQLDRFAEALAQSEGTDYDGDVPTIARQLGISSRNANGLMQRLRQNLGPRAR